MILSNIVNIALATIVIVKKALSLSTSVYVCTIYTCVRMCMYTHMLYVCIAVVHCSLLWAYVSPSTHAPLVYSRQSHAVCVHTTPSEWYGGGGCVVKTF